MKTIVVPIRIQDNLIIILRWQNGDITHCFEVDDTSIMGNIYLSKIVNLHSNTDSAFIDYQDGQVGFLNTSKKYKVNDIVLTQNIKPKHFEKKKYPMFSDSVRIIGCYLDVFVSPHNIQLPSEYFEEFKNVLDHEVYISTLKKKSIDASYCIIKAIPDSVELIEKEISTLIHVRNTILKSTKCGIVLHQNILTRVINKILIDVDGIISNDEEIVHNIQQSNQIQKRIRANTYCCKDIERFITNDINLYFGTQDTYHEITTSNNVRIIFQKTYIGLVIDINRSTCKDSIKNINLSALPIIVKYITLRNITGLIVIDFINMNKDDQKILRARIKQEFEKDIVKPYINPLSKFSILEIHRPYVTDEVSITTLKRLLNYLTD